MKVPLFISWDWRFWMLVLALVSLFFSYLQPTWNIQQNVYRYIFVVDISQSMNAPDYNIENMPSDRLSFVKKALQQALHAFPCGSEIGLGLFTTKNIYLLLEPLELCEHFFVIDDVIAHIDWRMAWAFDSNIERGLYVSMLELERFDDATHLVFLTDGEQTVNELHHPPLRKNKGKVEGLIVGVGSTKPVRLPKLDQENISVGYWDRTDFGYSNSSFTTTIEDDFSAEGYYLSRLREHNLIRLAELTGLNYYRLKNVDGLIDALTSPKLAQQQVISTDVRWLFGLVALVCVVAVHFPIRWAR